MLLDERLPEWDFQEKFSIFIRADPESVFQAIKDVKVSDMASAYSLLFVLRFMPDRVFGKAGPKFAEDEPLLNQMMKGDPMPFVMLGEERGKEIVFGGAVNARIGRVWEEHNAKGVPFSDLSEFDAFHDDGFVRVASNMNIEPSGGGSRLTTITRVSATSEASRRSFAPYWYMIRFGGGMVRRAWLKGIKRCAESA